MSEPIFENASTSARESRESLARDGASEFIKSLDEIRFKSGANAKVFAQRARDIITTAYIERSGQMVIRDFATKEQVEIANKLIGLGITEAVYGRGRSLLRK